LSQGLPAPSSPIPDFCAPRHLLLAVATVQVLALAFALLFPGRTELILARFVMLTLYTQAITLIVMALLCALRRFLMRSDVAFAMCLGVILVVTAGISAVGFSVTREVLDPAYLSDETRFAFVLRNTVVSALVGALLLSYFWARWQWEQHVRTESEARYQALSARIRPHFLFNSLNSIAALISIKPAAAETMVEDLADLFRASLSARAQVVPMSEELELVRKFFRIEQTRLGARLGVEWDIPEAVMDMGVPMLTIQPLVENAVHHGVARIVGPATVVVRARIDEDSMMVVDVENPVPPGDPPGHTGSQTAVANIAQRVRLIYGDKSSLALSREDNVFRARMRFPARPAGAEGVDKTE
jgi:two-component system sensor histidine kinase AlgZ